MRVGIAGFGKEIPFSADLRKAVKREFEAEVDLLRALPVDGNALDGKRGQYDAEQLLRGIEARWLSHWEELGKCVKVLGVSEADLFVPGMNYVFGLASLGGRSGVVSTARLRTEFYGERKSEARLKERLVKEVLHEFGHLFGLKHCEDGKCVMSFSNSVAEVDEKEGRLCAKCRERI